MTLSLMKWWKSRRGFPQALVALAGGLVIALALLLIFHLSRAGGPEPRWMEERHQQVAQFTPDGGAVEEALSSEHAPEKRVGPWVRSLGRPMPPKPYPDQRRPPCARGETEINGGCWVLVGNEKPPCGDEMFDYQGACYFASFTGPKTPTSEEP